MITKFNMIKGTATPINNHGFFCGLTVNIELSTDTEHRALKSSVVTSVARANVCGALRSILHKEYLYTYSKPIDPEKIHDQ